MNSLIRLWNAIANLAASLERTVEIVNAGNERAERSLGIDAPAVKMIDAPEDKSARKSK